MFISGWWKYRSRSVHSTWCFSGRCDLAPCISARCFSTRSAKALMLSLATKCPLVRVRAPSSDIGRIQQKRTSFPVVVRWKAAPRRRGQSNNYVLLGEQIAYKRNRHNKAPASVFLARSHRNRPDCLSGITGTGRCLQCTGLVIIYTLSPKKNSATSSYITWRSLDR